METQTLKTMSIDLETTFPSILEDNAQQNHLNSLDASDAIMQLKADAWEAFKHAPEPKRMDPKWRFSKMLKSDLSAFSMQNSLEQVDKEQLLARSKDIQNTVATHVFADNELISNEALPAELAAQGVIWLPLSEAFQKHPDLLVPYLKGKQTDLGSQKYLDLHTAYSTSGTFLYIPKGVKIDKHFCSYHWQCTEKGAQFPTTVIIAEEDSQVSLVDFYFSKNEDTQGLNCSASHIHAAASAKVFRKSVQSLNSESLNYQIDISQADKDSEVKTLSVNLGSKKSRFENQIKMAGERSKLYMHALTVAENNQAFDQRTLQCHDAPSTYSNLLYKNALLDKSQTIFSGLIKVDKVAQQTDAYQTNRNLLLSDAAEANSMPGLEIEANDVKCSHGATSGKLEDNELFYMLSRGITKRQAQELMVFGFFEEVIQELDCDQLADLVRTFIQRKFEKKEILS